MGPKSNVELLATRSWWLLGGGPLPHVHTQSLGAAELSRDCGENLEYHHWP